MKSFICIGFKGLRIKDMLKGSYDEFQSASNTQWFWDEGVFLETHLSFFDKGCAEPRVLGMEAA